MKLVGLLLLNLTACVLLITAIVTPGWFGLEIASYGKGLQVFVSIFYSKLCGFGGSYLMCLPTTLGAFNTHVPTRFTDSFHPIRYIVEASLTVICVGLGTLLTIIITAITARNKRSYVPSSVHFSGISVAGLSLNIIGVICGGILTLELIIANINFENVLSSIDMEENASTIGTYFPYSILIMSIGLVLEIITIIYQVLWMKSRSPHHGWTLVPLSEKMDADGSQEFCILDTKNIEY